MFDRADASADVERREELMAVGIGSLSGGFVCFSAAAISTMMGRWNDREGTV